MQHSVGILDFQGGVEEHVKAFQQLTPNVTRVKYPEQLNHLTHLVIPGGESTVIGRYLQFSGIDKAIIKHAQNKTLAMWGTCAGAILLGNSDSEYALNLVNIELQRNGYGRQISSFQTQVFSPTLNQNFEAVFIRAPIITKVASTINILAKAKNMPILCRENNILISTFHPELTNQSIIQQYFLNNF